MTYNLESFDDFINEFRKKEVKYYEEKIEQIETNTLRLFTKTSDHSLNTGQLKLLRRQLQQSITIYEYGLKNDKFEFVAMPNLKEQIAGKHNGAIHDLKNALTVVETKLEDKLLSSRKDNSEQAGEITGGEVFIKPELLPRLKEVELQVEGLQKNNEHILKHYQQFIEEKKEQPEPELQLPTLDQIFDTDKPGYSMCLELFKELEFLDAGGNIKSKVKANEILGLAVALKETSHNLLNDTYTDDQLMEVLQKHLKVSYTPSIKRRGKGYELTKEDALKLINLYMKKARAI